MFIVYILYSRNINRYYIGFTAEAIEVRLKKHLSNHKGFTARTKDWEVVHKEVFEDKSLALFREKQIKNWKSAQKIKELITNR